MTAPTGCAVSGSGYACSFSTWSPPLMDSQFSSAVNTLIVNDINGVIPSGAFSGLACGSCTGSPQISLDCGYQTYNTMTLLSDSLSSNLTWVESMLITDCYNMNWQSGAFSVLTGMTILTVIGGNFTSISGEALSGMTSLNTLYFYAEFPDGVPSGLFDGLTALVDIDMSRTTLNSLPSGLFDDLLNLQSLQLIQTGLTTLPSDLFYALLSLTTLDITENNWVCDCDLKWLGTYLFQTGFTMTNLTCASPSKLRNFNLTTALLSLTSCSTMVESNNEDDAYWHYGLTAGASLALLLAVVASCFSLYIKSQHDSLAGRVKNLQTGNTEKTANTLRGNVNKNSTTSDFGDADGRGRKENVYDDIEDGNRSAKTRKRVIQVTPSEVTVKRKAAWDPYRGWNKW